MKLLANLIAIGLIFTACKDGQKSEGNETIPLAENKVENNIQADSTKIDITPISHATAVINWGENVIYTDPVGGAKAFEGKKAPSFILVTDIHGDHMNAETLMALNTENVKIIVPKAVQEKLPEELQAKLIVMNNGDSINHQGFSIKAIPMYNLPQTKDAMHVKGRGNGYVIEKNSEKLYIAGDTEDIPEMKNLKDIDVALIPMNLPYTMPIDQAAEGVLAFQPKKVIPYHYRGKNGFSDVQKFKELVNSKNKNIEVSLLEWYPEK